MKYSAGGIAMAGCADANIGAVIARFEDGASVSEPFEQIYHHYAGLAGYGRSSYIDLVICRDRDANANWADGLEAREYVLQNWRADVVALAAPDGDLLERITYDAYGIPFATWPTDLTTGERATEIGSAISVSVQRGPARRALAPCEERRLGAAGRDREPVERDRGVV